MNILKRSWVVLGLVLGLSSHLCAEGGASSIAKIQRKNAWGYIGGEYTAILLNQEYALTHVYIDPYNYEDPLYDPTAYTIVFNDNDKRPVRELFFNGYTALIRFDGGLPAGLSPATLAPQSVFSIGKIYTKIAMGNAGPITTPMTIIEIQSGMTPFRLAASPQPTVGCTPPPTSDPEYQWSTLDYWAPVDSGAALFDVVGGTLTLAGFEARSNCYSYGSMLNQRGFEYYRIADQMSFILSKVPNAIIANGASLPPKELQVTAIPNAAVTALDVTLSWKYDSISHSGFGVEYIKSACPTTTVTWTPAHTGLLPKGTSSTSSFVHLNQPRNQTLCYRVYALVGANKNYSSPVSITTPSLVPSAPHASAAAFYTATATSTGVQINWSYSGITPKSFRLEVINNACPSSGGTWTLVQDNIAATLRTFSVQNIAPLSSRCYRVLAQNDFAKTASNSVNIKTPALLAAPTMINSTTSSNVGTMRTITLKWKDNTSDENFFSLEYSVSCSGLWNIYSSPPAQAGVGTTVTYKTGTLNRNTKYCFRVKSRNQYGLSVPSAQVTVNPN